MWLLENLDDIFEGRRLWLRPGKLYLFGRTVSEPGQFAISDKTISRKHLTIQVDDVPEGGGRSLHSRSKVTIEDLKTKIGTLVNGEQIRGAKYVLTKDENDMKMGSCSKLFRITWHPVVLSFSFTSKELRADPWTKLREELEQLDIKYLADYDIRSTTHVVAKKRNTSKGLQALINGRYIVTDTFITAIAEAATSTGTEKSRLELDFDGNWPDALQHLPPRGEEPSDRPIGAYAPDGRRQEVFDRYTFVFYEKKQYENLHSAITNGKGKGLLMEAVPNETKIDDFVRYVKGVAGEKGIGSFEDGSEREGVVVVRYLPAKGGDFDWFVNFTNSVSLRLDHRLIEQRDFLDAILACDASMLRRPLQEASQPEAEVHVQKQIAEASTMEIDEPPVSERQETAPPAPPTEPEPAPTPAPAPRRSRARRAPASRFKGFDADGPEDDTPSAPQAGQSVASAGKGDEIAATYRRSQRKRAASPLVEEQVEDVMADIAPTATAVKRRRIEAGEDPVPPRPVSPTEEQEEDAVAPDSPPVKSKARGTKKASKKTGNGDGEVDILDLARQTREESAARAAAEAAPQDNDDVDWRAIRRLHIIEECPVRAPAAPPARLTRDVEITEGRWDPKWNGRRNFKGFRRQGQPAGRPAARVIVGLEEVKSKAYGIGDDYWLEDEGVEKERRRRERQKGIESQSQTGGADGSGSKMVAKGNAAAKQPVVILDDSPLSDPEDSEAVGEDTLQTPAQSLRTGREPDIEHELPRTRAGKAAQKANTSRRVQAQSQAQPETAALQTQQTQARSTRSAASAQKRAAAAPPTREQPAKRPRTGRLTAKAGVADSDGDDSDDGQVKFRFGRR